MQHQQQLRRFSKWWLVACLAFQILSLGVLGTMVFYNERLEAVTLKALLLGQLPAFATGERLLLQSATWGLLLSISLYAIGIFIAPQSQRSLKHLFVLTTMIALAMGVFSNWKKISWEGRRIRMAERIEPLRSISGSLLNDWPTDDMNHDAFGPIMAYPQWNPTTLILLTPMPIDDRYKLAAVDRSSDDVLRFELSSGYETIWLERRDDNQLDSGFTNGIAQNFTREHYVTLAPNWYLVRYQ